MLIATFGYTTVGYAVAVSILLSLGLTAWGIRRRQPVLLLAASLLSLFFAVAELPSIGLFVLPLPFLQCALGIWSLHPGNGAARVLISIGGGLAFVPVVGRLILRLL